MTTFSFPVNITRHEPLAGDVVNMRAARVPSRYSVKVSAGQTGLVAGTTTIPLFVAPAGSTFYDCTLDITTAFDNTAGVSINVGVPTSTGILFAATTVNTAGRRMQTAPSGAQVSAWAIPLTSDTTVEAQIAITTSAITVGEVIVHVVIQ